MKKSILLLAAITGFTALAPVSADAAPDRGRKSGQRHDHGHDHNQGPRETRVTYDRHGHKIYWVKEYQGRDRKGRPVFGWVKDERRTRIERERDHRGHDHDRGPKKGRKFFFFSR